MWSHPKTKQLGESWLELSEVAKRWKTWLELGENLSFDQLQTTAIQLQPTRAKWVSKRYPNPSKLKRWLELGVPFGQGVKARSTRAPNQTRCDILRFPFQKVVTFCLEWFVEFLASMLSFGHYFPKLQIDKFTFIELNKRKIVIELYSFHLEYTCLYLGCDNFAVSLTWSYSHWHLDGALIFAKTQLENQ